MSVVAKLRYMGRQYGAGQAARGGEQQKHYLEEAADLIESLTAERDALKAKVEMLTDGCSSYSKLVQEITANSVRLEKEMQTRAEKAEAALLDARQLSDHWEDVAVKAGAELKVLREQKPVAWMWEQESARNELGVGGWDKHLLFCRPVPEKFKRNITPLYPAPFPATIPEGWKLVPVEPTHKMCDAIEDQWMIGSTVDMAKREYKAALNSAPDYET